MTESKFEWHESIQDLSNIDPEILEKFPPFLYNKQPPSNFIDLTGKQFNGKLIKMHRLIMGVTDPKIVVDHIYHNENGAGRRYDNRKCNLRVCEHMHNMCNTKVRIDNISGVAGVSFDKRRNTWYARITYDKQEYYLGPFNNKEDAIAARKSKEKELFGEYQYKEYIDEGAIH